MKLSVTRDLQRERERERVGVEGGERECEGEEGEERGSRGRGELLRLGGGGRCIVVHQHSRLQQTVGTRFLQMATRNTSASDFQIGTQTISDSYSQIATRTIPLQCFRCCYTKHFRF